VILASEAGVIPVSPERVIERGRLSPGKMLLIDLREGRIIPDEEIKTQIASQKPYHSWVIQDRVTLDGIDEQDELPEDVPISNSIHCSILQLQRAFGYTQEEVDRIILPMAIQGEEASSSMGNDTPLAILSEQPQLLFKYFRQLFAQVTNPPIDPIRESLVMSLATSIGPRPNLLFQEPGQCRRIQVKQPILTNQDLKKIKALQDPRLKSTTLKILFEVRLGEKGLRKSLGLLCRQASNLVKEGYRLLILSDREVNEHQAPIPSLLALSAIHHHLILKSQRAQVGLIVETGEARDVHQLACLFGYGAGSVNPYLVFDSIVNYVKNGRLSPEIDTTTASKNYISAINKGLLKVMSKMGISTIQSYCGAQIFEAIGLSSQVIDRYFSGTVSRLGGLSLDGLATEALQRHALAFSAFHLQPKHTVELPQGGEVHYQAHGETHFWNPQTISTLQWAARNKDLASYEQFSNQVNQDNQRTLRGLLQLKLPKSSISIEEVEPVEQIVRNFTTGAMSFGALGQEAHETLAIAMNRIGAKSNSGEGGEDPARFDSIVLKDVPGALSTLYSKNSAIKQVASARFGVTTDYLIHAQEIQIKMAQGAKPGEGGQLPGHKVDETIARLRYATPGVQLISPPPHHDIYSIEDLAQLIFDLKNVNPKAKISVKLVAEAGIGAVAAGVAKAHADKILISGDTGGTGASPLSSIKYAGIPWEIGLAETHQTLVLNGLRHRIRLETDGQLKTGRDVVIAALLGAEEFGFSTAPLIVEGCIMMRKCHLNTCPVGIATQDPILRKKFMGQPEHIINYFFFVAQEARKIMATLGVRTLKELVGRVDLLETRPLSSHWKTRNIDLSLLLHPVHGPIHAHSLTSTPMSDSQLDRQMIDLCKSALEKQMPTVAKLPILNTDRAVGALLSNQVVSRHGPKGLPTDSIKINFTGSAGQSLGGFLAHGITFRLEGEANDYVGKGLSGGRILIAPPKDCKALASSILIGNTCLYGATSGELFAAGIAGERFAVRNSGALTVVEGVGDHGCEYMTGGLVLILGPTGKNFAAGMSGGIAYVFDEDQQFESRCNLSLVQLELVSQISELSLLYCLIQKHQKETGSLKASYLLEHWLEYNHRFVKVIPTEFQQVTANLAKSPEIQPPQPPITRPLETSVF
jgi:glutamate synthase (NADPH/NADH) large chain/glutamate synthase (ferredoxin)